MSQQQLPKVLEAKLKRIETERASLAKRISDAEKAEAAARRAVAELEVSAATVSAGLAHARLDSERAGRNAEGLSEEASSCSARLSALGKSREEFARMKIEIDKEIYSAKEECSSLYSYLNSMLAGKKDKGDAKGTASRMKALREEAEATKIAIASLEKENEIRDERIRDISRELKEEESSAKELKAKVKEAEAAILEYGKKRSEVQDSIKSHGQASESLLKELQEAEEKLSRLSVSKGRSSSDVDRLERELMEKESARSQLQTRLSDIKAELISYSGAEEVEYNEVEELEKHTVQYKHEMELLGNVNLKAPEAYAQRKKDVDEANERLSVLRTEKESILSMINEIESKKLSIFNETFSEVNNNFKELYSHIFDGSAHLYLDNPNDPFSAKLHFNIQTPGRKQKSPDELSGGQKSLLMLALIFSIQMRNPMAFYILDEIDSSLDKENSKKLSKLIKELSSRSQFIVVSHNDSLIAAADTAIGVTKQNEQSQVVGIQVAARKGAGGGLVGG